MSAKNKCIFMGNFTKDPEILQVGSDHTKVRFTIAVNRPYQKDKDTFADFPMFEAWDGKADFIARNFTKGSPAIIESTYRSDSYEGNDGKIVYTNIFRVDNIDFGGSKSNGTSSDENADKYTPPTTTGRKPANRKSPVQNSTAVDEDDDFPLGDIEEEDM